MHDHAGGQGGRAAIVGDARRGDGEAVEPGVDRGGVGGGAVASRGQELDPDYGRQDRDPVGRRDGEGGRGWAVGGGRWAEPDVEERRAGAGRQEDGDQDERRRLAVDGEGDQGGREADPAQLAGAGAGSAAEGSGSADQAGAEGRRREAARVPAVPGGDGRWVRGIGSYGQGREGRARAEERGEGELPGRDDGRRPERQGEHAGVCRAAG